jgi:hypothetical protein
MLFCRECGGALNLFESNDEEVCWNCVRKREKTAPPAAAVSAAMARPLETEDLGGAAFCVENNLLVLKASEGWVLWSGPIEQPAPLATIITRARQIYRIRKRSSRNGS